MPQRLPTTSDLPEPDGVSRPVVPLRPSEPPPTPSGLLRVVPLVMEDAAADDARGRWWQPDGRSMASFLVSSVVHATLIVLLALIVDAAGVDSQFSGLSASLSVPEPLEAVLEDANLAVNLTKPERLTNAPAVPGSAVGESEMLLPPELVEGSSDSPQSGIGLQPARPVDWLLAVDAVTGGGLEGRTPEGRARLVAERGGNRRSEEAVERGLHWLVAHQLDDGSWNFDHNKSACNGLCRNPGNVASTTAATSIALLAFLGAGYTQAEGEHQHAVSRAFYYLMSRARSSTNGADLQEGTMYAQGLAAIAISEAYAMTGDPGLAGLAQRVIDFVVFAQDKNGGGWRYSPGEPGDTTVTGWQFMGLKSGRMAGLQIPPSTFYLVERFLDSVQSEDGARYGYMGTDPRNTTTAVGLLCRMYGGYTRSSTALSKGVGYLGRWGPSKDDFYYNYYATQVMFHWEGSDWVRWNAEMRDQLIATQAVEGHESGSWHSDGGHGDSGGRLYNTAMAVMTLEVYYRYMPLYGNASVDLDR